MSAPLRRAPTLRPLVTAGLVIGIGMGGFVDGILFHQVLQIHNMLSARVPTDTLVGAKVNMVWDGLFDAVDWFATAAGIVLLWRALRLETTIRSGRALVGACLAGCGLFDLVEGVIDHHLLGLHHVYERAGPSVWDGVFLLFGAALLATGWLMVKEMGRA